MSATEKPPLGIIPKRSWQRMRIQEVLAAMMRYTEVNKPIPPDWICEVYNYIQDLEANDKT